ncbi:MAG TPA: DNA polymerase IV [Candidatus Nanoarchaeia archaeon]|nr:DNA polymerase IV [Candidatus Nanoarchaeia archaeon]
MADEKEFPKAILHVDGDAFFVACEVACNPSLKGRPVVSGGERGIATAMSYEAKALGVGRGMPVFQIRKLFPQVIVVPSQYRLYEIFSQRMFKIISRFSSTVEWYSIDECFADITGLDAEMGISYDEIAKTVQETLYKELGITFSVGLSVSKVLAKVASKWKKPNGLTIIPQSQIQNYLRSVPLGKIWGIGPKTNQYLYRFGIETAQNFVDKGEEWVRENCAKPMVEIWYELSGKSLFPVYSGKRAEHKSFASTETFMPTTNDPAFLFSELSRHVEDVARSARRHSLMATRVSFFLKTKDFRYRRMECVLSAPTSVPSVILEAVRKSFGSIFDPVYIYRATGVTLHGMVPSSHASQDLFGGHIKSDSLKKVYDVVDSLLSRYGSRAIYVCSSLGAFHHRKKKNRGFNVPILGKVR